MITSKPERIEELGKIIEKLIPEQHRDKLLPLIGSFADIFALPNDTMTTNNFYTEKFKLTDEIPPYTQRIIVRRTTGTI